LQFIFAWFFLSGLQSYLDIQAQLAKQTNAVGATMAVAIPIFNLAAILLMMLTPIFTMRLIAEERRNQTLALLLSSPISVRQIILGKFFGLTAFLSTFIIAITLMVCTLGAGTQLDYGLLGSNMIGLLLLVSNYVALGLYISTLTRQPVIAAIGVLAMLVGLWLIDLTATEEHSPWHLMSPIHHFQNFSTGLLDSSDTAFFLIFTSTCLLFAIKRLKNNLIYG
jgi:ABC-2 type transport system permease protein